MDKSYINGIIHRVLNKEFSNIQKRKTVDYNDRVNFACPYCGDSHRNAHAKRGNFYYNRLIFICFNCDKKTTFDRFCKDFNEQLDPDKKLEMIEHLNSLGYKMNEDELDGQAVRVVDAWNTLNSDVESFLESINQSK